jgi:hypothetical protein
MRRVAVGSNRRGAIAAMLPMPYAPGQAVCDERRHRRDESRDRAWTRPSSDGKLSTMARTPPAAHAPRTASAPVAAVVVVFWLLAGLAEMATLYFDPAIPDGSIAWQAWCKRGGFALYWIGVTFLALRWYRNRPVDASTVKSHLATTALASLALTALYVAYSGLLIVLVSNGRSSWTMAVGRVVSWELVYVLFKVWQIAIVVNAYYHYRRLTEREREQERLRLRLAEMRLMLFRAQLEPHFLFNTLNSIAALVRLNRNASAVDALNHLGGLLRGVLEVGERQRMPWRWERDFTQRYIALQTLRFGDRLDVHLETDGIPDETPFPVMLLQPLIENAIHHGRLNDGERCIVRIAVGAAGSGWRVEVRNAVGTRSSHESRGVGLANVESRLRAIYGDGVRFEYGVVDGDFVASAVLSADLPATDVAS